MNTKIFHHINLYIPFSNVFNIEETFKFTEVQSILKVLVRVLVIFRFCEEPSSLSLLGTALLIRLTSELLSTSVLVFSLAFPLFKITEIICKRQTCFY